MRNEDTRVQYTKTALKSALLKLLEDMPIAKVTVKDLCETAGLNRGTFYLHYREPNDVLKEIEEEFISNKMSFFHPYMKNDSPAQLASLFQAVLQNREMSLILFGPHGAPAFTERIKEAVREGVLDDWQREFPDYKRCDLNFVYDFLFQGSMQLILSWLKDDGGISAEEFAHRLDCLGHAAHLAIRKFQP